ncbi:MAG: hypothetical protein GWN00_26860 [Aliifodinibius sp.]|nr:hypothetical protein [Fodinibius sp.]NIY28292.1 hypothetical protein [Fodinibius sp.]
MKQEFGETENIKDKVEFYSQWGSLVLQYGDGKTIECITYNPCRWLSDNGCAIYGIRPTVCKKFDGRTASVFLQKNCKLHPIRKKEALENAEASDNKDGEEWKV